MAKKKLTIEDVLVPKEEIPYEVPENWCWVKLGRIAEIKGGKRLPKGKSLLDEKTEHPYIRVADFYNGSINLDKVKYIDDETNENIKNYYISKEDVYISIAGTIGKVGIIPDALDGAKLTENSAKITNLNGVSNKYLYLAMQSEQIQYYIKASTVSTSQPKLALFRIKELPIPVPPLAEQVRIVNRIESLFDKVDKASELVDEARDGFEKRRAAILERAFCGELTKKWREENGVSDEWETLKLGDIIKEGPQNGLYKPKSAYGEGHLIVRIDNFYDGSINPWNTLKRLQLTDREIDLYSLDNGDFVVNRVNSIEYLGKSALVRNLSEISVFESNVMRFKIEDGIDREYVIKYMNSPKGLRALRKNAKHAVNQASINQQDVKSADIPIPILNEQLEIVRILNRVIEEDKESYELSNIDSSIDIIKRSILAKAFRGELGSNDLDDKSSIRLLKDLTE